MTGGASISRSGGFYATHVPGFDRPAQWPSRSSPSPPRRKRSVPRALLRRHVGPRRRSGRRRPTQDAAVGADGGAPASSRCAPSSAGRRRSPQPGSRTTSRETDRSWSPARARNDIELLPRRAQHARVGPAGRPVRARLAAQHVTDYAAFLRALSRATARRDRSGTEHPELPRRPLRIGRSGTSPIWTSAGTRRAARRNAWAPEYAAPAEGFGANDRSGRPRRHGRARRRSPTSPGNTSTGSTARDRPPLRRGGAQPLHRAAQAAHQGRRSLPRRSAAGPRARKPVWLTESTWPAGKGRVSPCPEPLWQRAWYTTDSGMAGRLRGAYRLAARRAPRPAHRARVLVHVVVGLPRRRPVRLRGAVRYREGEFEPQPALAAYAAVRPPLAALSQRSASASAARGRPPGPPRRGSLAPRRPAARRRRRPRPRCRASMPPMANHGRSPPCSAA